MSKFITAINVMVSNPKLITNVHKGMHATECFFKYDKKHLWSILKNPEGEFYMSYFPGDQEIDYLASIPDEHWEEIVNNQISYNSKELGTKEAKQSLSELYTIVNEKVYGIDEVLDDIINSNPDF